MTLINFENSLFEILSSIKKDVEPSNYLQWTDFYYKVKNSTGTDEEKLRQYNILLNAIKAYNEAIYRNSGLTMLKDTLKSIITNIDQIPGQVAKFLVPTGLIALVVAGILIFIYAKGSK
jgi:hypothetical protein